MKEKLHLRKIEERDVPLLIELVRNSFRKEYLIPSIYRAEGIDKFIEMELSNPFSPYKYFVMCDHTRIYGYAEFKVYKKKAFLNMICVESNEKNRGLGRRLINHCIDYFKKTECNSIELDVFRSNNIALKWYVEMGFSEIYTSSFFKIPQNITYKNYEIKIENYSHFKEIYESFKFGFLIIRINEKVTKVGVIDDDLFIRDNIDDRFVNIALNLKSKFLFNDIYVIRKYSVFGEYDPLDEIIRMKKNI